jgi:hypothetical protein
MQFDQYGKPVSSTTRSTWKSDWSEILRVCIYMAGLMWVLYMAYNGSVWGQEGVAPGTADATPDIMRVVVVGDRTDPTPEPTLPACQVGLERNTLCMWRITPTPVGPCPPSLVPAQCTYDGPEDFREYSERLDKTPEPVEPGADTGYTGGTGAGSPFPTGNSN